MQFKLNQGVILQNFSYDKKRDNKFSMEDNSILGEIIFIFFWH